MLKAPQIYLRCFLSGKMPQPVKHYKETLFNTNTSNNNDQQAHFNSALPHPVNETRPAFSLEPQKINESNPKRIAPFISHDSTRYQTEKGSQFYFVLGKTYTQQSVKKPDYETAIM